MFPPTPLLLLISFFSPHTLFKFILLPSNLSSRGLRVIDAILQTRANICDDFVDLRATISMPIVVANGREIVKAINRKLYNINEPCSCLSFPRKTIQYRDVFDLRSTYKYFNFSQRNIHRITQFTASVCVTISQKNTNKSRNRGTIANTVLQNRSIFVRQ